MLVEEALYLVLENALERRCEQPEFDADKQFVFPEGQASVNTRSADTHLVTTPARAHPMRHLQFTSEAFRCGSELFLAHGVRFSDLESGHDSSRLSPFGRRV